MATSRPSTQKSFRNLTYWLEDFPARHSPLQGKEKDLLTSEEISFLRSFGFLSKQSLNIFSWKTSRGFSITMRGRLLKSYSTRLQNWGMISNGKCLTARISECRNTGNESILSDILEQSPDHKYFLSKRTASNIMYRRHK